MVLAEAAEEVVEEVDLEEAEVADSVVAEGAVEEEEGLEEVEAVAVADSEEEGDNIRSHLQTRDCTFPGLHFKRIVSRFNLF